MEVPAIDGHPRPDLVGKNYEQKLSAGYRQHLDTDNTNVPVIGLTTIIERNVKIVTTIE